MQIKDGHIHTPFCPHGTSDPFKHYIEQALKLGYKEMTFTEHAPLPSHFADPVPKEDSAMSMTQLENYINELKLLKLEYEKDIKINIGLEVDYIEGFEEDTTDFLNNWGEVLDDAILSVHFLKCPSGKYICIDYSPDSFAQLITEFSSLQSVYTYYYETLKRSIISDLGKYKPNRIGHITLIRKFQLKYPKTFDDSILIKETLELIKDKGLSIDLNGAGLIKPLCKEFYPPLRWAEMAQEMGIKLVYGSDAHSAGQLGQGISHIKHMAFE